MPITSSLYFHELLRSNVLSAEFIKQFLERIDFFTSACFNADKASATAQFSVVNLGAILRNACAD